MALTSDRDTPRKESELRSFPVAASTKIFAGALVALNASGFLVPGATATTLKAVGRAEENVDNSAGGAGAKSATVRRGTFRFGNSADTDAIARADINGTAYIVDDETVAKTSGTNTRSIAGTIHDVDAQGVWVRF